MLKLPQSISEWQLRAALAILDIDAHTARSITIEPRHITVVEFQKDGVGPSANAFLAGDHIAQVTTEIEITHRRRYFA